MLLFASVGTPAQVLHNGGFGFTSNIPAGVIAANATATNNAVCKNIAPYYLEIDNGTGPIYSISVGTPTVTASTAWDIASASKMMSAIYIAQALNSTPTQSSATGLALNFSDGYNGMGSYTKGATCNKPGLATAAAPLGNICNVPPQPSASGDPGINPSPQGGGNTNSIAYCMTLCISQDMYNAEGSGHAQPLGSSYGTLTASQVGSFSYDSAHLENLANNLFGNSGPQYQGYYWAHQPSGPPATGYSTNPITSQYWNVLGVTPPSGSTFYYAQPLLAGGIVADAQSMIVVLRAVANGSLYFKNWLGINQVCAQQNCTSPCLPATQCGVVNSPVSTYWHYGYGHWVESDPAQHNDFSYSSPGAFGEYPWIQQMCPAAGHQGGFCHTYTEAAAAGSAGILYAGIVSRNAKVSNNPVTRGVDSAKCAAVVRYALFTGVAQSGSIPNWQY